ncbi:hypothetical protein JOB18_000018 [Solea senegalensis]|uniref:Uncharacterized protein n=1 Tax=Solea senegalensis TaxID=28829 RepID=A0AAV6Q4S9_SOLSE|nr:hypothetical protein JOB18_000018 [Solea senegalensis]
MSRHQHPVNDMAPDTTSSFPDKVQSQKRVQLLLVQNYGGGAMDDSVAQTAFKQEAAAQQDSQRFCTNALRTIVSPDSFFIPERPTGYNNPVWLSSDIHLCDTQGISDQNKLMML